MLVLLPPSEGKTRPGRRRGTLVLDTLSWPELNEARSRVLAALAETSGRHDALNVLGVGASLASDVEANRSLHVAPTAPAGEVYSGVLYDALALADLSPAARRRANRWLVVTSALWGVVRPTDRIPAYRLSMGTTLPGIGTLAGYWRPLLDAPLTAAAGRGLVVDLRSSTYQAAWTPSGPVAARTVAVRVLREVAGRRTVVSHMAKHTRGQVCRLLLESEREPRTAEALALVVGQRWRCELVPPIAPGRTWTLDVVIDGATEVADDS
ncbi:YaaA family protein [Angustibacter sp. McL0619]|uniref:YaaA family protein n=1 Tax=Angustibacter sp. McL0619 TaxID=3415676 RepID=UPI003CEFC661